MPQIEVSLSNQDRLESNPNFNSIDETLTHVLDVYDDAWHCILSGMPQTEELKKLKDEWGTFETSEFKKLEDNICLLFIGRIQDPGLLPVSMLEDSMRKAVKSAIKVFIKEHFEE